MEMNQKCVDARNGEICEMARLRMVKKKKRTRDRNRDKGTNETEKRNCLVEQQISIVTWLVMYNLSVQFAY